MGMLDDIGTRLTSQGLVDGATGWTLRAGFWPETPDQMVWLGPQVGREPEVRVEHIDFPVLEVRVRAGVRDYATAETKMMAVWQDLHDVMGTLSGTWYRIKAKGSWEIVEYDKKERPVLGALFDCTRVY